MSIAPATATASTAAAPASGGDMVAQIMTSLKPLFAQQSGQLNESLANAGIVGGSTTGAQGALANQQTQQATAALVPIEQQAAQLGEQNREFNAGQQTGTSATNASQINQFVMNALGLGNANALQQQQLQNTDYLAQEGYQNQDWLAELEAQTQLATSGQSGQTNAFQPVFTQPTSSGLGGFSAGLGSLAPQSTPAVNPSSVAPSYAPSIYGSGAVPSQGTAGYSVA